MKVYMFTFGKNMRLLKYNQFNCVFKNFKLNFSTTKLSIFGLNNYLNYPRIGIIIPKKYVRFAHERNHIKRLIREYFRLHQCFLPKMDFVILVKNKVINLSNKEFNENLKLLWQKYQV